MEYQQQHPDDANSVLNKSDIEASKPTKSRFLFLLSFFGFFIFCWAGCYNLYKHKAVLNKDVQVPENTKYEPTYK